MAKTGRTCDFTGDVFGEGAVNTGTITVLIRTKDNPLGLVTTYDVTAKGLTQATEGWPTVESTRAKFKRAKKTADDK